jgi:hypothetical protein
MDESYASGQIARRLKKIRIDAPNESIVRHNWAVANAKYREHVIEGRGDSTNGSAIVAYYVERQAYFLYAQECGFSLEVM